MNLMIIFDCIKFSKGTDKGTDVPPRRKGTRQERMSKFSKGARQERFPQKLGTVNALSKRIQHTFKTYFCN